MPNQPENNHDQNNASRHILTERQANFVARVSPEKWIPSEVSGKNWGVLARSNSSWRGSAGGGSLLAAGLLTAALVAGCKREPPPGADPGPSATASALTQGRPELPTEVRSPGDAGARDAKPDAPYEGPYFVATESSVGVYVEPNFDKKRKLGYLRSGGHAAVKAETVKKDNCKRGWYQAIGGGYMCGDYGTTDLTSRDVRFAVKQPDLSEVLPYKYARNAKNGTPLYKSVPTPEQMLEYEPYLPAAKKKREQEEAERERKREAVDTGERTRVASHRPLPFSSEAIRAAKLRRADAGASAARVIEEVLSLDGGAPKTPWWQQEDVDDRLHEVSLEELSSESDHVLAKRMVKGFYVAIDKQFSWNHRPWYKTTKGLVAPADRFWITDASDFKGREIDGETVRLPVAWTYGWNKSRPKYELDPEKNTLKPAGSLERFDFVNLTGKEVEIGGKDYVESVDGFWVRKAHVRMTRPGPPPVDLGPKERWVDVNLSTQTLVAFIGVRAVYATLISSGKENRDKEKDHRTPSGEWRIREKHVTTTMDGDGTAAGDLPYSIEDVPYVMYFYRAYALHGAFWHKNYGVQMSHGCVNLAPLDAKHIFFFTEPHMPKGWHGVWSSESRPGSRVVVHE